jgi:hypothetical protein
MLRGASHIPARCSIALIRTDTHYKIVRSLWQSGVLFPRKSLRHGGHAVASDFSTIRLKNTDRYNFGPAKK